MTGTTRVLVVDDQVLFRKGLARVLADWPDIHVVGEAEDGLEAVARARELHPDVVIMDINMPNMNGLEATPIIRSEVPEAKIVMLTVSEQDDDLFRAIKAGAHGYILKNIKPEVLYEMVVAAGRGEAPISPLMAAKMMKEFARQVPSSPLSEPAEDLTPRERDVLALVAAGADNSEIATRLCVTPGTVKRHMHNILSKLHARSRVDVVLYAVRHGITSPGT